MATGPRRSTDVLGRTCGVRRRAHRTEAMTPGGRMATWCVTKQRLG
jgi:hypothetical protein